MAEILDLEAYRAKRRAAWARCGSCGRTEIVRYDVRPTEDGPGLAFSVDCVCGGEEVPISLIPGRGPRDPARVP